MESLSDRARQIPSMGGCEIGSLLMKAAREAPNDTAIVEVGCWLGAGTAQLALGIKDRAEPERIALHCYDRWQANESEVEKASRFGLALDCDADTLPVMRQYLSPFDLPIQFHKGDILGSQWTGGPISIYVDDAAKKWQVFYHVLLTFGPHWIPGETLVVLMDYDIWTKTGMDEHMCQKRFIEENSHYFERIQYGGHSEGAALLGEHATVPAVFRYTQPFNFERWVATTCARVLDVSEKEVRHLTQQVQRLRESTSWRLTSPIRMFGNVMRAFRKD